MGVPVCFLRVAHAHPFEADLHRAVHPVRHEDVYLKAYESVAVARRSIGEYVTLHTTNADTRPLPGSHRMRYRERVMPCLRQPDDGSSQVEDFACRPAQIPGSIAPCRDSGPLPA